MKVNKAGKEEDYPLSKKEFKERVSELFLKEYEGEELEKMTARIENIEDFIDGLYGQVCFSYDNPQIYGENSKKSFEDYLLESVCCSQLRMLLEG